MMTAGTGVVITWTPEMLERFKAAYAVAKIERATSFWFDGHEFIPSYARYLIMYLDDQFGTTK